MALIVEDGTGLTNSESYISTAELTAYGTKWGLSFGSDTTKLEALCRKATRAIDLLYEFIGERATDDQALEWPRSGDEAPSGVPGDLKAATCEMAYIYLTSDPLAPLAAGDGGLTELTKEVGDLKVTKKWLDGSYVSSSASATRKVTLLLQDLLASASSFMVEVVRG